MSTPSSLEKVSAENVDLKALQQVSFEQTSVENPTTLQEYINLAKVMAGSGFYPDARTAQQAVALMILGRHFGLTAAQSLTAIHVVKGKPMLHYSAILAKVQEHPLFDYEIIEDSPTRAEIAWFVYKRGDWKEVGRSVFTLADAKRQDTQNLTKFPDTMLIARATSNGAKRYVPQVLNGMPAYVHGEMPDDAEHGDAGKSKRDVLKAELQARQAARGESIDVEAVEIPIEKIGKAPDDEEVPEEQVALL